MNKTVLIDEEILPPEFKSGNDIQVTRAWVSKERIIEILRATEQAVLQSPEIQQALADSKRLDFLADKNQTVANVLLPIDAVMNNMGDMRAAIDEVMEAKP